MADKTVSIWVNVKGNAKKALAGLNKSLKKTETQTKKTAIGFKSIATAVGGLVVLKKAAAWMAESTRLALEQEKAEKKLSAALGHTSQSLLDYASALQMKTTFGDEETIASMALVANFVKEEEQIKRITAAAQDMAEAKGMSLASSTDLITKSVASSTNALTRYGVEIEGAAGSTERIDSAITNLTAAFGGMAEAAALTSAGQIKQMDNAIGDMRETVGEELLPAMIDVKRATVEFYEFIINNKAGIISTIRSISDLVTETIGGWDWMIQGASKSREELAKMGGFLENQAKASADLKDKTDQLAASTLMWNQALEENADFEPSEGWLQEYDKLAVNAEKARDRVFALGVAIKNIGKDDAKAPQLVGTEDFEETKKSAKKVVKDLDKLRAENAALDTDWKAKLIANNAEYIEIIWQQGQDSEEKTQASREENMQTAIDIAVQTAQGIQAVMSAVNNKRQQEHDNEVQRQKDEVKNSAMSAKQKAVAMEKIEKEASKNRLKLRLTEWRQALVMSIVNTAVGVTASAPLIPKMVAVGALGLIQTGIIEGNKPKAFNGMVLNNSSGMTGDVIPVMARKGEEILSPSDPRNVNNGGGASQSVSIGAPQIVIQGNTDSNTVDQIKTALDDFGQGIEEMFTNGKINASIVNQALAV